MLKLAIGALALTTFQLGADDTGHLWPPDLAPHIHIAPIPDPNKDQEYFADADCVWDEEDESNTKKKTFA